MRHHSESLGFPSHEHQNNERTAFLRLEALGKEHDARLEGAWVNTGSHTTFALIDAPNAHVVNRVLELSGDRRLGRRNGLRGYAGGRAVGRTGRPRARDVP